MKKKASIDGGVHVRADDELQLRRAVVTSEARNA